LAKITILNNSISDDNYLQKDSAFYEIKERFEEYGFSKITILHTRDSARANNDG